MRAGESSFEGTQLPHLPRAYYFGQTHGLCGETEGGVLHAPVPQYGALWSEKASAPTATPAPAAPATPAAISVHFKKW